MKPRALLFAVSKSCIFLVRLEFTFLMIFISYSDSIVEFFNLLDSFSFVLNSVYSVLGYYMLDKILKFRFITSLFLSLFPLVF